MDCWEQAYFINKWSIKVLSLAIKAGYLKDSREMMQQMLHTVCCIHALYDKRYGCLLLIISREGGTSTVWRIMRRQQHPYSLFKLWSLKRVLERGCSLFARMSALFCFLIVVL